jgi:hypothetical protein
MTEPLMGVNGYVGKRILVALGAVMLGTLAALPVHAGLGLGTGSNPGVSSLCRPAVTGVTAPDTTPGAPAGSTVHYGALGATVTVSGFNFATPGCTLDGVKMGSVTIKPGTQGFTVSPLGTSITFTLPAEASGAVSVAETDVLGNVGTSNANYDFIQTPSASLLAPTPVEGSVEPVSGADFAPFLPAAQGGLPGADVLGAYNFCSAANQWFAGAVQSDSALQLSAPTAYCDGELELLFLAPYDSSTPMDCSAASTSPAYNCVAVPVAAGDVDVYFYISSVNPTPLSTVPVGTPIVIQGSGFGASGDAAIAGIGAAVHWSDTKITVYVPTGALSGVLFVQRTTGDHELVGIGTYYIGKPGSGVVPPTPTPTGGSPTGVVSPPVGPGYGMAGHPGRVVGPAAPTAKSAAQDDLTLLFGRTTAPPGATVHFVVYLSANGKPVSGAPVVVKLISAPGTDATLSPASGLTNAAGKFAGVLHLSKTPGQHLVVAQSGMYSDEVTVLGSAAQQGTVGINLPFGLGPLNVAANGSPVVVWLSAITGALLLFGVLVSINVVRRAIWSFTGRPMIKRFRGTRAAH